MTTAALASTPEREPWRVGAGVRPDGEASPPARTLTPDELATLDELDEASPTPRGRPDGVHSISHLVTEKRVGRDLDRFKKSVLALKDAETQTLILRIHTTQDPLMLWGIHATLDGRGIAPALRWPPNIDTPQGQFISWLADVFWFTKRNPDHRAKFAGWGRLLATAHGSQTWLEGAYWIFAAMYGRQNVASYTARGLALTHEQRQPLMTLQTSRMVTARLELQPKPFAETRQRLLSHTMAHPNRAETRTPEAIAEHRAKLWRVYILSGKSPTVTAENWKLLTREVIFRQSISKQIDTIKTILKRRAR
jgi:hypothetical protein